MSQISCNKASKVQKVSIDEIGYLVKEEHGAGVNAADMKQPRRVTMLPHLLLAHVHDRNRVPLRGCGRHGILQQPRRAQRGDHGAQALPRFRQDHVKTLGTLATTERLQEPLLLQRQEFVQMLDLPALEEEFHERVVCGRRPITPGHYLLERNPHLQQPRRRRSWQNTQFTA